MKDNYTFTVIDFSVKSKSKSELYNFLSREGDIYLSPKQDAANKYLRDLMMEKKLYVKCRDVLVIKVPQYGGLKVKDLIRFAGSKLDIHTFLPEYSYHKKNIIENGSAI